MSPFREEEPPRGQDGREKGRGARIQTDQTQEESQGGTRGLEMNIFQVHTSNKGLHFPECLLNPRQRRPNGNI